MSLIINYNVTIQSLSLIQSKYCQIYKLSMSDTDRQLQANNQVKSGVLYQEQFYNSMFFCCFIEKRVVVIKNRTLYIHEGCKKQEGKPGQLLIFFHLMYAHFKVTGNYMRITCNMASYTLRHPNKDELLKLQKVIEKAIEMISVQEVYPNMINAYDNGSGNLQTKYY